MKNEQIGSYQLMVLVFLFTVGSSILVVPGGLASNVQQDAWLPVVLGIGLTLALSWFYLWLSSLFPDQNLIDITRSVLGKWVGGLISLLFLLFLLLVCAPTVLYYLGDFMTTQIMPETPIQVFHIMYLALLVFGVRLGLETLARSAELLFPLYCLLFIAFVLFVAPQAEGERLQPMFEAGVRPILSSTLHYISFSGLPLILFLMVIPACKEQKKRLRTRFLLGNLIGGLFLLTTVVLCLLVLGVDATSRSMYPNYALARKINIFNFINRIEVIMALMWFVSLFYKLTFYFYAGVRGLAQMLGIEDYRVLTVPVGMIVYLLSLLVYPNPIFALRWDATTWPPLVLTFGLAIPLLLTCVALLKRKVGNRQRV